MKRPSRKEIFSKIKAAKQAISDNRIRYLNLESLQEDADDLGYLFEDEFLDIFSDLLENTNPDHYAGTKPPQRSYEPTIKGAELFAFNVKSSVLGGMIYYKFSIKNDHCYVISLHKDRKNV